MSEEIFEIEKSNLFQDEENYYFFRALNMGDLSDIEQNITVNSEGEILRIRTDLERYPNTPIYSSDSSISLKEVFDHIKEHHRIDTNCISLTSNANVAAIYGRGSYKDKYVMIKVPKKELGTKVYNAGLYMMEEIQKRIDTYLKNNLVDEMTKYHLSLIENTMTQEKLNETMQLLKSKYSFENNQLFMKAKETNDFYQDLTEEQAFETNKMIAQINVLKENILSDVDNNQLIQTLETAFSSFEFIHYKEIKKEEIIEISKEMIDLFAILQQVPKEKPLIQELKAEILQKVINKTYFTQPFLYENQQFDGTDFYKKVFYFVKSKLRALNSIDSLMKVVDINKYESIFLNLNNYAYGVEPVIFSNLCTHEETENKMVDMIQYLSKQELVSILEKPEEKIEFYFK